MKFKNKKSNFKKKFKQSNGDQATNKFLYQRQENRKKQIKDEEELWQSVSESDEKQENEKSENSEVEENEEDEEDENSEHSDSNSENEIYKQDEENDLNLNSDNLEDVNLTLEEKEKINSMFLESIDNCRELKKKIDYTCDFIKNPNNETKFGLSFLDSKNGLMIMYETYMLLYSMMKYSGINIDKNLIGNNFDFLKEKNIFKNLISCRTFLEKIKSIDIKLKTQIDRFMKLSEQETEDNQQTADVDENEEEEINATAMRPKILDEEDDSQESEVNSDADTNTKKKKSKIKSEINEDESEEENQQEAKKNIKYKVKKNFLEFFETSEDNKKRQKKLSKLKEKIKNSEYYNSLKEEFTDNPKEFKSETTHFEKLMKEVEDYEDETMQRIKVPKRDIKLAKKRDREEFSLKDLGQEFKQFDRIMKNELNDELEEHNKMNKLKHFNKENGFEKKHHFNKKNNKGRNNFKKFKK